ncbi:TPM domain-containing protein [Microbacterium sp. NPDC055903]
MSGRMRFGTITAASALLGGILIGPALAAGATAPPALDPGYVSDVSGVLDESEEARLEQLLGDLAAKDGRPELYVVLVPRFEDPANALAWADDTAQRNNLAPDQYLLAIATEGRTLAISAEYGGDGVAAGPLSEARVLDVENALGADHLAHDDWAGGIEYVAGEFDEVPWPWWVWMLGIAALAIVIFLVVQLVLFIRRRVALSRELRSLDGQRRRAARLLVQADEAIRTSAQELGFVTAEFGEETTAEFAVVLDRCREQLREGFLLLEKLEDSEKDTLQETRSWTESIIRLCGEIDGRLEGRKRELEALRALTASAPATLNRLTAARAEAAEVQAATIGRLASLTAAFDPVDLIGVADNADEIERRLRDADVRLEALRAAVSARKPKAISDGVHEIERLLAEVSDLHDAVDAQAETLSARAVEAASTPESASSPLGSGIDRAAAAVRAAESSVQARAGQVSAFALSRLQLAQSRLAEARSAQVGSEESTQLAASAQAAAEQVQSLVGSPVARERSRFVRPAQAAADRPLMFDTPASASSAAPRRSLTYEERDGTGAKAVWGGFGGGFVGFISSIGVADDAPGIVIMFVLGGIVLGALSGAFGRSDGGSSSGWGGSSSRSWGGSSRSSSRSSGGSSRSSGGSRSSGRSGGRRF